MVEQEYRFITIVKEEGHPFSLGQYTDDVAVMHAEVLGLTELENKDHNKVVDDLEIAYWNWIVAIVVTNAANETVGFCSLSSLDDEAVELSYAYVRPEDRRKGIYKQMVQRRLDLAQQYGAKEVSVQLMADSPQSQYLIKEGFVEYQDEDCSFYRRKF